MLSRYIVLSNSSTAVHEVRLWQRASRVGDEGIHTTLASGWGKAYPVQVGDVLAIAFPWFATLLYNTAARYRLPTHRRKGENDGACAGIPVACL